MLTMLVCNEEIATGIDRIPETVDAALQDLRDYHTGTAGQMRNGITRSFDVASEAILADLDSEFPCHLSYSNRLVKPPS